jgi:7,8-dihydro-6-hydroxymethylpterin-pyrophosphokinase
VNFTDNQSGIKNSRLILFNADTADSYNIELTYNEVEEV